MEGLTGFCVSQFSTLLHTVDVPSGYAESVFCKKLKLATKNKNKKYET